MAGALVGHPLAIAQEKRDIAHSGAQALNLPEPSQLLAIEALAPSEEVHLSDLVDRFVEWSRSEVERGKKAETTIDAYAKWRRAAERVGEVAGVRVLDQDARRVTAGWCQRVHDAVTVASGPAQADNVAKEGLRTIPLELLSDRGWAAIERQRGRHERFVWPGQRGAGVVGETTCASTGQDSASSQRSAG